ncbi:MAG: ASCH domain-containing protein [Acholeplasmataceae bacterium]
MEDGGAMKALTILQPYAELIRSGEKRVENREWYTTHRGWLAIHAGKGRSMLQPGDLNRWPNMTFGAVVALALVDACVSLADVQRGRVPRELEWVGQHCWAYGPYCWVFGQVVALSHPVGCRGWLGVFDLPVRVERDVAGQIGPVRMDGERRWLPVCARQEEFAL